MVITTLSGLRLLGTMLRNVQILIGPLFVRFEGYKIHGIGFCPVPALTFITYGITLWDCRIESGVGTP